MSIRLAAARYVGKPVPRIEDRKLLIGRGSFIDDLWLPRTLHAAFVRSAYPHAVIRSIDVSRAVKAQGVVAVFTGADLNPRVGPLAVNANPKYSKVPPVKPLAERKVRYVGEPVAMVVAEDRYAAYDAVALVEVGYEPLQAVVDPEEALRPGSPLVHEEFGDNVAFTYTRVGGDPDGAFRSADRVVRYRHTVQRVAATPIEPRGILASYDPSTGQLEVHASHQFPHSLREWTSEALGIPQNRVRVVVTDVGGAFGSKIPHYPEDVAVPAASVALGRPVKWVETRRENLSSTTHGRGLIARVELAAKSDGRLLGVRVEAIGDVGAYFYHLTQSVYTGMLGMVPGVYKLTGFEGKVVGAFTNKVPTAPYRGAGRPEASFLIERSVERLARELGIDPAELRLRNFIRRDEFPYKTVGGHEYDSGDYEKALRRALELVDYLKWREEQRWARQEGRLIGIGISTYVEVCNFASQSAKVRVEPDGKVTVFTSTSPHGQGDLTAFAQLVADYFGIGIEDVSLSFGDTQSAPYGGGTAGSWTLVSGGSAILSACERVAEKMRRIAAHLLEARPEDVELIGGRFSVKGVPERSVGFEEVAKAAYDESELPDGEEVGLEAYAHHVPKLTYPFGAHVAVVEVDPETGRVDVKRAVLVDDAGNVVNPMLVEGQVVGGAVQALGQALLEEVRYGPEGNLLTESLADYLVPTACEVPEFVLERTVTPAPNPLGAKGVGEAATIGFAQAVVNAVEDALSHLNIAIERMPVTPDYIWSLMRSKGVTL
ncbi:MAG: glyceraldehyde dehydrogenase subunit alpha [Thaumarchaeota archaeon]|nr:glyceraldehyde dehydrogenase subunit alpha [Candidatus Calditenuaceae archaeon]MDW8043225.1 glyceraldehyde dehydrogenase subunit alpha [Nitrososphaerota archaeon]